MLAIETKNLTKKYKETVAVDNLNISIEQGEIFGLLGPNGAGKTTTLRMLSCLISPSSGSSKVAGFDITIEPSKVRKAIGILTESPSLYERLTAYENMDFFAEAYGLTDAAERKKRIEELLSFLGLSDRMNDKVSTFSKGMKQKLAIARSIVHKPEILLLDEPTSNLDPEAAKEIRDMISALSQKEKRTVILCTHHLEDAEKICNRVMIMNKGKSIAVGTPDELREKIAGQPSIEVILKSVNFEMLDALKKSDIVKGLDVTEDRLIMKVDSISEATPKIVRLLVEAGGMILSVNVLRPSLEEAYLRIVNSV
jgi:ABC-2 type transport system ATP-binding protein